MHDKGQLISDRGRLWLQTAHMLDIHMGAGREEGRKGGRKAGREEGRKDERKDGKTKGRKEGRKMIKLILI